MSAVIAVPDLMVQAATDLARIGDTLHAAHMTAAVPTTQVLPAAADEVSASIAHLMSGYGQEYQKMAGQAAASYEQFAQQLTSSAVSYASAEAANIDLLQPLTTILGSIGNAQFSDFLSSVGSQIMSLFFWLFALSIGALILSVLVLPGPMALLIGFIRILLVGFGVITP